MSFGYGFSFGRFEAMFTIVFTIIIGAFIVTAVKALITWDKNNKSPRLTVPAVVVTKRYHVSHHQQANAGDISGAHGYSTTSSTRYYATFEFASGDRMELSVSASEYGMLAEGDKGDLTFQGTRYLSFERK